MIIYVTNNDQFAPFYTESVNAAIDRGREDIAMELAADYDAVTGVPTTRPSVRPSTRLSRWRHRAARVGKSVDDYTLDTFNPSPLLHDSRR